MSLDQDQVCPWTRFVLGPGLSLDQVCPWTRSLDQVFGPGLSLDQVCPWTRFVPRPGLSLDQVCPWTRFVLGPGLSLDQVWVCPWSGGAWSGLVVPGLVVPGLVWWVPGLVWWVPVHGTWHRGYPYLRAQVTIGSTHGFQCHVTAPRYRTDPGPEPAFLTFQQARWLAKRVILWPKG